MKAVLRENELSYAIRRAIFTVYNTLGPGLLESVYEVALCFELRSAGFDAKSQVDIPVNYKGEKFDVGFRLDVLVENLVIVELKSIQDLSDVHHKIVLTYLKLANKKLGLLVNFNTDDISKSIFRKVNGLE
jgi:GxxExxY protein